MSAPPDPDNDSRSWAERRGSVRYLPQIIRDISAKGMGLILSQSFESGTPLAVELHSPDMSFKYTVLAKVVHCTKQADGAWLVGCAFSRELNDYELKSLLSSASSLLGPGGSVVSAEK